MRPLAPPDPLDATCGDGVCAVQPGTSFMLQAGDECYLDADDRYVLTGSEYRTVVQGVAWYAAMLDVATTSYSIRACKGSGCFHWGG